MDAETYIVPSADGTDIGVRVLGSGPAVVVLGGAVRTGADYLPLARAMAARFQVHVVDRRGRGLSGPQGPRYGIDREVEDLYAVLAAAETDAVVAHSFGGLVALEAARTEAVSELVVYEPGVSVAGSIEVGWTAEFTERLEGGDSRGAFATFVRGSGQVPPVVRRLPLWYLRAVLRLAIRGRTWARIEPVLPTVVPEHLEVARLDGTYGRYAEVAARTLLLAGSRGPASTAATLQLLAGVMPQAEVRILDGLDHLAPSDSAPQRVAEAVLAFLPAGQNGDRAA